MPRDYAVKNIVDVGGNIPYPFQARARYDDCLKPSSAVGTRAHTHTRNGKMGITEIAFISWLTPVSIIYFFGHSTREYSVASRSEEMIPKTRRWAGKGGGGCKTFRFFFSPPFCPYCACVCQGLCVIYKFAVWEYLCRCGRCERSFFQ